MKMSCTVKPNVREYTVTLSQLEAKRLSLLMTLIDPDNVALQHSLNMFQTDSVTEEMTKDEVLALVEGQREAAQEAMQEYAHMIMIMEQLKTLSRM